MASTRFAERPGAGLPFVEQALTFAGTQGLLTGVISRPTENPKGVVLILADPSYNHAGENRLGVEMARALAGRGLASLRFDVTGQGDSPGELLAPEDWHGDIAAAASALRDTLGSPRRFWIFAHAGASPAAVHALPALQRIQLEPDGVLLLAPRDAAEPGRMRPVAGAGGHGGRSSGQPADVPLGAAPSLLERLWHRLLGRSEGSSRRQTRELAPSAPVDALGALGLRLEGFRGKVLLVLTGVAPGSAPGGALAQGRRARSRLRRHDETLMLAGADRAASAPGQRESVAGFLADRM